jgi:hypothetical protein
LRCAEAVINTTGGRQMNEHMSAEVTAMIDQARHAD